MKFIGFILFSVSLRAFAQNTDSTSNNIIAQPVDSVATLPKEIRNALQSIIEDSLSTATKEEDNAIDMGLLIVNETRTRVGAGFYTSFYQQLTLPSGLESATVVVTEEPFRGTMTRLLIYVNGIEVVEALLRPNAAEYLEELLSSAVARVSYYINNYQEVQESLNGEDLSGSGIY